MNPGTKLLGVLSLCGALCAGSAEADYTYMGHCTGDPAISPEDVVSACTVFITRAFQENWQLEKVPVAMRFQAAAYAKLGKDHQAETELASLVAKYPRYFGAWEDLGKLLEKTNGPGMLMSTMDAMLQKNPDNPDALNEACWIGATSGEQLDKALADCDAALQLKPGAAGYLDSRALANLRMSNFPQAIADATAALAKNPKMSGSVYVRGVARLKSGDAAGGNADIAAAKEMDAKMADIYAAYGVTP
jgi:tetratricopeptide (TPR) repeat protein